jgi:prepilin-type N-terminal cleavage/methylation domain-containing protein
MGNNKGLTLIEVLVSIGILSLVISMIFGFLIDHVRKQSNLHDLNELHYQSQIVNNHLQLRLSQCTHYGFNHQTNTLNLLQRSHHTGGLDRYSLKLKGNGDLIENYNEMANYISEMIFTREPSSSVVSYQITFNKGTQCFILENTVYLRNVLN